MLRGFFIFLAVILIITYSMGLTLFLTNLKTDKPWRIVLGLAFCGLPTGIVFLTMTHWLVDSSHHPNYKTSAKSKILMFLLGTLLGLVVTPIFIIILIVKAIRNKI